MGNAVTLARVSGAFLCPPSVYAPAGQTMLTVSSTSLAAFGSGLACTGPFTAPASGAVLVGLSCIMQASAGSVTSMIGLVALGTVTPVLGSTFAPQISGITTAGVVAAQFYVPGLVPGQLYQLDLAGATTAADTLSIVAIGASSTALGVKGAPVVMTVQGI